MSFHPDIAFAHADQRVCLRMQVSRSSFTQVIDVVLCENPEEESLQIIMRYVREISNQGLIVLRRTIWTSCEKQIHRVRRNPRAFYSWLQLDRHESLRLLKHKYSLACKQFLSLGQTNIQRKA